ncbi:MAG: lipase family protein [Acidimicrobiales bacterium]
MRRHLVILLAVALGSLLFRPVNTEVPSSAAAPLPPNQDPFYAYSGPTEAHGTVLSSRAVDLALGTVTTTPVHAEQLLYATTDELGNPSVTATTVLVPTPISVAPHIVEYLSFYDGLSPLCDPSYTLAGGNPGSSTYEQEAEEEELLISWYLSQGDIVTVPDFEGEGQHWMAGLESGQAALDAITSTESFLGLPSWTKVGLSGYSGGAVAANWASNVAPAYAPKLNLVGVAMGGIDANYLDMFNYINGNSEYSVAIPAMLLGLSRAYGIDLDQPEYLSSFGRQVVGSLEGVCMASVFGTQTVTMRKLLATGGDLSTEPALEQIVADQTMGNAGVPREPLLMGEGNSDGTGDGAMVAADVAALARKYCSDGVPVEFLEYPGAAHEEAAAAFEPQTGPFLQARFAGTPFVGDCSAISTFGTVGSAVGSHTGILFG